MEKSSNNANIHEDTELRLCLPGMSIKKKRSFSQIGEESTSDHEQPSIMPPKKVQAIGWPPIRAYRKNCLKDTKYVKVSLDGAPYLRKIDLKVYKDYKDLLTTLEEMFKFKALNNGLEYEPTYEDKDGDWMLVGDVPWDMFIGSCKRIRLMKRCDDVK